MILERFSEGDSLIHRLDPAARIVAASLLILVIALADRFSTALLGMLAGATFLVLARLPLAAVFGRLLLVNTLILLFWLTLPFSYGDNTLFSLSVLQVRKEGVLLALLLTLKANAILLLLVALLATASFTRIGHGLQRLRLPEKLCLLLLFTHRYIFVIHEEFQRLHRSARLRCFSPSTSLHTYRTYGHLFGMILVRSWNRGLRVKQAMDLRGFDGRFFTLHEQAMQMKDYLFLGAAGLLALILMGVELT